MKSKKLTASVMVAVVLLVVGCNGGEECPPVVSGPAPGPIIDIGGNGATVIVEVSGSQLPVTNPTADTLDPRFFLETHAVGLVDCDAPDVHYLGKNQTLALFHANLTDRAVIKRGSDGTLTWSCAIGPNLTTIRPGGTGDIPQCLADAVGPVYELESGETGKVVVLQTLE